MTSSVHGGPFGGRALALVLPALAVVAVLLWGCGSSSTSSKPSYCAEVQALKTNVKALGEVNVAQGGTNAVKSALQKVESSARGLVTAAKSEFPTQTQAIESSISALSGSVNELSSSGTAVSAATKIPGEVAALSTALTNFTSAAGSKCG